MDELTTLKQWVAARYLVPEHIKQIQEELESKGLVILDGFLQLQKARVCQSEIAALPFSEEYLPNRYKKAIASTESLRITKLLSDPAFLAYLELLARQNVETVSAIKLEHRDYSVLHDQDNSQKILIVLDFTSKWPVDANGQLVTLETASQEPLFIRPAFNQLAIIDLRKRKVFRKYINNYAKKHKIHYLEFQG